MNLSDKEVPSDLDLAFWKDKNDKHNRDIKGALEQYIKKHKSVDRLSLCHCDLNNIDLVDHNSSVGHALHQCDLYKANLEGAHLFKIDFSGSSLMKSNLENANLHCANLESCNLLGVKIRNARLENVNWGKCILQENLAKLEQKSGNVEAMWDYYEQAEEIYRNLRIETEKQGLFEKSGYFFRKEMIMRRLQMPILSYDRLSSKVVDLFCGYGEKPFNVVMFSLFVISVSALFYFVLGVNYGDEVIQFSRGKGVAANALEFLSCLYFSVVTFTTLGYGELTPTSAARVVSGVEAFVGSFTMALFVVVFVKKMTR